MSQSSPAPNQRVVTELKVSAHLMLLDPGVFCIFHAPGTQPPDPVTRLPGVRISRPPAVPADVLDISTFNPDGWLGGEAGAALVRVSGGPAQVLVSIYQAANAAQEAPKLQVLRLSDQPGAAAAEAPAAQAADPAPAPGEAPEVAAHVQRRGDLLTRIGSWMGVPGSQNWIEGFAIQPASLVAPADIEYQAVLGKGWLSPWAEGGKYCGSRGMALPILGLRVRLKGEAAENFAVRLSATFIDGSEVGPLDGTRAAESDSLAPLEAFKIEIVPLAESADVAEPAEPDASEAATSSVAKRVAGKPDLKAGKSPAAPAKPTPVGRGRVADKPVAKPVKGGRAR